MLLHPLAILGLCLLCSAASSGFTLMAVGQGQNGVFTLVIGSVVGAGLMIVGREGRAKRRVVHRPDRPIPGPGVLSPAPRHPVHLSDPREDAPTADPNEMTLPTDFVPDFTPQALAGLDVIYELLKKPDVHGYLLVVGGPDRKLSAAIRDDPVPMGRGPDNGLRLKDASVSVHHATVLREPDGKIFVRDEGSKNGTYLNNQQVQGRAELENCDMLAFGATKVIVLIAEEEI